MKRIWIALTALFLLVCAFACGTADGTPERSPAPPSDIGQPSAPAVPEGGAATASGQYAEPSETTVETEPDTVMKMNVQIGDKTFTAALEDNAAAREFIELMREAPVSVEMSDYSGFEKVGPLGRSLTADDSRMTTEAGDIVLYNGSQIVMFYGSNSWSYTKLGRIDDLTDWEDALGSGGITAVFTLAE